MSQGEVKNLVIDNNRRKGVTILNGDNYTFSDVIIKRGTSFYLPSQLSCTNLNVQNSILLVRESNTTLNANNIFNLDQSQVQGLKQDYLNITSNEIFLTNSEISANVFVQGNSLILDSSSKILSTGFGHLAEQGSGAGIIGYGGSYGGLGGRNYESSGLGQPYGNEHLPDDLGSGGGNSIPTRKGGSGGGKINVLIYGQLTIDGQIISDGESGMTMGGWGYPATGAGSGGTVYISANNIIGTGTISANGGSASSDGGGGGGGRIAVYGNVDNFTGIFEALGGINSSTAQYNGSDGTIYLDSQNLNPD
jgi:hypothetical protein